MTCHTHNVFHSTAANYAAAEINFNCRNVFHSKAAIAAIEQLGDGPGPVEDGTPYVVERDLPRLLAELDLQLAQTRELLDQIKTTSLESGERPATEG